MTDFKDALKAVTNLGDGGELIDAWTDHERTILLALRIADRLNTPSKDMYASWMTSSGDWHKRYSDMIDQLLREIEQEQHQ